MTKKQSAAAEFAANLTADQEFGTKVQDLIDSTEFIRMLVSCRIRKNLTQKDVAEKMGVSKSKISKLEAGTDDPIRLTEFMAYLDACDVSSSLLFEDNSAPAALRIKHLVYKIHDRLNELVDLAKRSDDDRELCEAINVFKGEVLFNFLVRYKDIDDQMEVVMKPHTAQPDSLAHRKSVQEHRTAAIPATV